jgi:hypothetical protein
MEELGLSRKAKGCLWLRMATEEDEIRCRVHLLDLDRGITAAEGGRGRSKVGPFPVTAIHLPRKRKRTICSP